MGGEVPPFLLESSAAGTVMCRKMTLTQSSVSVLKDHLRLLADWMMPSIHVPLLGDQMLEDSPEKALEEGQDNAGGGGGKFNFSPLPFGLSPSTKSLLSFGFTP